MRTKKAPRAPLALAIREERSDGYIHVIARPCAVEVEPFWKSVDDCGKGWHLADFQLSSQGENARREYGLYSFQAAFAQVYSTDLWKAKRHLKTLASFERGMVRALDRVPMTDRRSFAEYLVRAAQVLGATKFAFRYETKIGYEYVDLLTGMHRVQQMIARWQDGG